MRKLTVTMKCLTAAGVAAGVLSMAAPAHAATRTVDVRRAPSVNPVSIAPLPTPYPNPGRRGGLVSIVPQPSPVSATGSRSIEPNPSPVGSGSRQGWIGIAPIPTP